MVVGSSVRKKFRLNWKLSRTFYSLLAFKKSPRLELWFCGFGSGGSRIIRLPFLTKEGMKMLRERRNKSYLTLIEI